MENERLIELLEALKSFGRLAGGNVKSKEIRFFKGTGCTDEEFDELVNLGVINPKSMISSYETIITKLSEIQK